MFLKSERKAHMNELKNAIKRDLSKQKEASKDRHEFINETDLAEIDLSLQNTSKLVKGSRFTHAQNFIQVSLGKQTLLL